MDYDNEKAIEIVNEKIAILMNDYVFTKDSNESKCLEEKINVLEKMKERLFLNDENIVKIILKKYREGIL